jgi:hypothetical protein
MALSHSPSIVINGLIFYVDFANEKSWPGSGNYVYDLSPSNNTGYIYNSPTIANGVLSVSSAVGSCVSFFKSPNASTLNLSAANQWSVVVASRYNGTGSNARGRILQGCGNNWLLGEWNGYVLTNYSVGWVNLDGSPTDNIWRIYCATGNTATNTYSFYVNGVLVVSNSNGTQGPAGLAIGVGDGSTSFGGSYDEPSDGDCGFVKAYNRELSANEVLQNFNALRGRYGL